MGRSINPKFLMSTPEVLNSAILKFQDCYLVYTVGVTDMPGLSK